MKKLLTVCMVLAFAAAAMASVSKSVNLKSAEVVDKAKLAAEENLLDTSSPRNSLDDCMVPFPEGAEAPTVVPALPACWVQFSLDASAPAATWRTSTGTAYAGTQKINISWSAPALDDWLISPAVNLTAGSPYALKFWRRAASTSYAERLDIWLSSTTQDVAGMTTNIAATYSFNGTVYVQDVINFVPTVTGPHYLGWHATSLDALGIYLDNIELVSATAVGRCCYFDGMTDQCVYDVTAAACNTLGGDWLEGATCTSAPCPTGRCCYGDACNYQCMDGISADWCGSLGGSWLAGGNCSDDRCPAPPEIGDICCNPFMVTGLPFSASGNTCAYTNDYDAVCPYGGSTSPDVVYSFTPAADVQVTFSLCLSGYDTKLYIYDGMPVPGGHIACNDDAAPCPGSTGSYRSYLECVQLYAGHSYCIVVDGYGGDCGDYTLTMESCEACDVICPVPNIPEGEPICADEYVDTYNGGCNDPAFSTLPLACGDVICGTSGNFLFTGLNYRDTDWYLMTVTDDLDSNLICLTAEFNAYLVIYPLASCEDINNGVVSPLVVLTATPCEQFCYLNCFPAGDYLVVVLPQGFTGVPCGAEYVLTRSCTPCAEPFVCHCADHPNTHCEYAIDNTTYPIDSAIPTTCVTINVPIEYQITDLNVCLDIVHTYDGDLGITLTSPMGTVIDLSYQNGVSGDNFTCTTFDDEAGTAIGAGAAPFSGSYVPDSPLSAVDGQNAVGAWVLCITDYFGGDTGWLNWVCLTFEYDIILPVDFGSFDAVAGDRQVTLNWNTLAETNVHHFDVLRNGSKVGEVAATNNASGATYSYTDGNLTNGTVYSYSLVAEDVNGARQELATVEATPFGTAVVTEYALHQNYPNPFNPTTNIAFDMVEAGNVTISVFNVMGQKVGELVNGRMEAGRHVVGFDATGLSSGLYLYKMEANGFTAQAKMVLMK